MLLSTEMYLYYSCFHVNGWFIGVGRNNQEVQKGIIPNKSRAEELATAQFNATKKELTASESRGSFFRRRRSSHRRSKSLSRVSKNCPLWSWKGCTDLFSSDCPQYQRLMLFQESTVMGVLKFCATDSFWTEHFENELKPFTTTVWNFVSCYVIYLILQYNWLLRLTGLFYHSYCMEKVKLYLCLIITPWGL